MVSPDIKPGMPPKEQESRGRKPNIIKDKEDSDEIKVKVKRQELDGNWTPVCLTLPRKMLVFEKTLKEIEETIERAKRGEEVFFDLMQIIAEDIFLRTREMAMVQGEIEEPCELSSSIFDMKRLVDAGVELYQTPPLIWISE